jgi:hypothetical protein
LEAKSDESNLEDFDFDISSYSEISSAVVKVGATAEVILTAEPESQYLKAEVHSTW